MKVLLKVFPPRCSRTRCSRGAGTSAARRRRPPSRPAKRRRSRGVLRGKQPKRRQRRKKRGCFEEAARLAGAKHPEIAMPRRCSGSPLRFRRPEPAKWPESFFPATLSASPRGIAAAAYAENMPPACFLNAAAAEKIPLREPECATPEARRARSFGVPRRNPAERLRWGEAGQRSGVQKAFSRRAF